MSEAKDKIRAFISRFFREHELKDDEDIFNLGFVNSLFAMQLVMFLEKEFNIKFNIEDMDFSNLRTINSMVELIQRKGSE